MKGIHSHPDGIKNAFSLGRVGSALLSGGSRIPACVVWPGAVGGAREVWVWGSGVEAAAPPRHLLGLRQRRGLVGLRVLPSVVVGGPLLLGSHLHDGLLGLVFPAKRVRLVQSWGAGSGAGSQGKLAAARARAPGGQVGNRARSRCSPSVTTPASCVTLSISFAYLCLHLLICK